MPRSNMYVARTALVLSTIANSRVEQFEYALQGGHNRLQILKEIASLSMHTAMRLVGRVARMALQLQNASKLDDTDSNFLLRMYKDIYSRTYLRLQCVKLSLHIGLTRLDFAASLCMTSMGAM